MTRQCHTATQKTVVASAKGLAGGGGQGEHIPFHGAAKGLCRDPCPHASFHGWPFGVSNPMFGGGFT